MQKYLKCVHSVRDKHRGVIKMLIGVKPRIINNEKGYIFLIIPFQNEFLMECFLLRSNYFPHKVHSLSIIDVIVLLLEFAEVNKQSSSNSILTQKQIIPFIQNIGHTHS